MYLHMPMVMYSGANCASRLYHEWNITLMSTGLPPRVVRCMIAVHIVEEKCFCHVAEYKSVALKGQKGLVIWLSVLSFCLNMNRIFPYCSLKHKDIHKFTHINWALHKKLHGETRKKKSAQSIFASPFLNLPFFLRQEKETEKEKQR